MTVQWFRKKPVVVEAVRYIPGSPGDIGVLLGWFHSHGFDDFEFARELGDQTELDIKTLEGVMTCLPGDWIIRGTEGEFYPCKPLAFMATYERIAGIG